MADTVNYVDQPDPVLAQRMEHLRLANSTRLARAQFKEKLKIGALKRPDFISMIMEPTPEFLGMTVFNLVKSYPGYGPTKARRLLTSCKISSTVTLGALSETRRQELASKLK